MAGVLRYLRLYFALCRFGLIREQGGVLRHTLRGFRKGGHRLVIAAHLEIRAAQKEPSLGVVGIRLHLFRQPVDHRHDLRIGDVAGAVRRRRGGHLRCGRRVHRRRIAQQHVKHACHDGHHADEGQRRDPARTI